MRLIKKKPEPRSLADHRKQSHADFQNYSSKDELREALVDEQYHLCCYCMSRIYPGGLQMTIEHWAAQKTHPHLQLVYENLLGACLGNDGNPPNQQHCDERKGSSPITLSPLNPAHVRRLRYRDNGEVVVDDEKFRSDINDRLNLNVSHLVHNRRNTLRSFVSALNQRYKSGTWSMAALKKELQRIETPIDGVLPEYVEILSYWLRKRIGEPR